MKPVKLVKISPSSERRADCNIGMIRINFKPYSAAQLEQIIKSRLADAEEGLKSGNDKYVMAPHGIKFVATKLSSITGDAVYWTSAGPFPLISDRYLV